MKGWVLLLLAIALEMSGTISMKYSAGFSKWLPSVAMFVCYAASFSLLNLAIKYIDVSVAYAVWSGIGTLLITVAAYYLFRESLTPLKIVSISLIIAGVIGLNLGGSHGERPQPAETGSSSTVVGK